MRNIKLEFIAGIFVLIGIIITAYFTIKLGRMELLGDSYYSLNLKFNSVSGLREGSNVEMSGVEIGKVAKITLDKDQYAEVIIKVFKRVPITEDAIASVKTSGLIGDKLVQISQGGSDIILKDGDRIMETESATEIMDMISKYALGSVKK